VKESAKLLQESGIPFQINTTLTPGNLKESSKILEVAISWGACAHHVFLLVPVGRALDLERDSFSAVEYEKVLRDLKARESQLTVEFKATCAPQYQRIGKELGYAQRGKGCLGGKGFMFVSSHGLVQACGYLPQVAGDIRQNHPREIYQNSQLFLKLRSRKYYQGKCGVCEYWAICGGCRARAQAEGNFLGEEPLCPYQPKGFADYNPQKTAEILK
jgi:radical SAM protein with 4Fe4S-binding SPASM domain